MDKLQTIRHWQSHLACAADLPVQIDEDMIGDLASPFDAVFRVGPHRVGLLAREWVGESTIFTTSRIEVSANLAARPGERLHAMLAAPHLPPSLIALAKSQGVSWLDGDGNAEIGLPGLRVRIRTATPARRELRGASVLTGFNRKVARVILATNTPRIPQSVVGAVLQAHKAQVSRAFCDLVECGVLTGSSRDRSTQLNRARLIDLMLEEDPRDVPLWLEGRIEGLGDDPVGELARRIESRAGATYAFTSVTAAARHLGRTVRETWISVYLTETCPRPTEFGFVLEDGGPIRICPTNDPSRLAGSSRVGGVNCVAPAVAFLDLTPECRATDWASQLYELSLGDWTGFSAAHSASALARSDWEGLPAVENWAGGPVGRRAMG